MSQLLSRWSWNETLVAPPRTWLPPSDAAGKWQEHRKKEASRGAQCVCLCEDSAQCLLPVVLMPPTVQELQAQLVGHLLGLNTAVLFSASIILSIPPVDFANHPSFALVLLHWHTQTCLRTHVPLYSFKLLIPALRVDHYLQLQSLSVVATLLFLGHAIFTLLDLVTGTVAACVTGVRGAAWHIMEKNQVHSNKKKKIPYCWTPSAANLQ